MVPRSSLSRSSSWWKRGRLDAEHGGAEHLQQPAVGVEGEPLVTAGSRGEPVHRLVVEPDVEHRLHHPGHRELRPGAHRHQQRPVRLAERAAHLLLQRREVLAHLRREPGRLLALLEVGPARVGADREARRHRQPEVGHLGQVGALAAEQVLLVPAALVEVVHELGHEPIMTRPAREQQGPSVPGPGRARPGDEAPAGQPSGSPPTG